MKDIQLNVFKDELPFSTWLLVGAGMQAVATLLLPKHVAVLPTLLVLSGRVLLYYLSKSGLRRNHRTENIHYGIRSARVPAKTADEYYDNGTSLQDHQQQHQKQKQQREQQQVVLFVLGARSTAVSGRRTADARRLSAALAEIVGEAERGRERYGFLGRSAPLMGTELGQGNTLVTLTYWRSVDGLMAFARESAAHRTAWAWIADGLTTSSSSSSHSSSPTSSSSSSGGQHQSEQDLLGGRMKDIGIMHEMYFCPESMARRYYINFRPFGFAQTKFVAEDEVTGEKTVQGPTMVDKKVRWPPRSPVVRSKSEGYNGDTAKS